MNTCAGVSEGEKGQRGIPLAGGEGMGVRELDGEEMRVERTRPLGLERGRKAVGMQG